MLGGKEIPCDVTFDHETKEFLETNQIAYRTYVTCWKIKGRYERVFAFIQFERDEDAIHWRLRFGGDVE
jgi:hypothetical protein